MLEISKGEADDFICGAKLQGDSFAVVQADHQPLRLPPGRKPYPDYRSGCSPERYEDVAVAIRQHSEGLESGGAQIRLLFVLHDGYPNDAAAAKKLCLELRGRVEVIGVLLDPDDGARRAMGEIFGQDRLVACASRDLPTKLAAMLRSIRGV